MFSDQWIGYNSAIVCWPARSPGLTALNYSIWGRLKRDVYNKPINTPGQLRERIFAAFTTIKKDYKVLRNTTQLINTATD